MQVGKCHTAETIDYLIYVGARFGETILQNMSNAEEEKPANQRNPGTLLLLELGMLGCSLIKFEVNRDLCNPIDGG